jgi:energy-coupling factor transporter ATP-binding protein EcfA2
MKKEEITEEVEKTLEDLNLTAIKDEKVKFISEG